MIPIALTNSSGLESWHSESVGVVGAKLATITSEGRVTRMVETMEVC